MTGVRKLTLGEDAGGKRLDRWMRARFPHLGQSRIEKYCRKGEIRVDGKRAKASDRLLVGQTIRLPPIADAELPPTASAESLNSISAADAEDMRAAVIYMDDYILAINKPPGTPVQGGTRQKRHVDAFAAALRFGKVENPRLVHRLDKDTSGVLLLARCEKSAREITKLFRSKGIRKLYLAVVAGVPNPREGTIRLALSPSYAEGVEKMRCVDPAVAVRDPQAKHASTGYKVIDSIGQRASLVALAPATGRKHQLRAHMAAIGHPIVGDGKYGARIREIRGRERSPVLGGEFSAKLHLHARCIAFRDPFSSREIRISAPLPPHFAGTVDNLGWNCDTEGI